MKKLDYSLKSIKAISISICFFIVLLVLFISFKPDKPVLLPTVQLRIDRISINDNNALRIETTVTLKNNTKDTVRYLYWTCLSPICYSSNKKLNVFVFMGQDSICQNVNVLAPGESYEFPQNLAPGENVKNIKSQKFKLGFRYVPIKKSKWLDLRYDEGYQKEPKKPKQEEYVIWSNEVTIN